MTVLGWIILFLFATLTLAFKRAALSVWAIAFAVLLLCVSFFSSVSTAGLIVLWLLAAVVFVPLLVKPLRRFFITKRIFSLYRKSKPALSTTEKEALEAGSVGWERELFSGMPNWNSLQAMPDVNLSVEERAFLDGPVEELCGLINNWSINHKEHEIPEVIWQHLKSHGFFSLIIPKEFGGKGFSALAHSQIITKVASVSIAVGSVVSVPNSLGPAELLLEYGTEEQKNYYLPRLAKGEEIPCFALTSPIAGSDAGSIEDHGVVIKEMIDGKEELGIQLNWDKRYITLAPIATLIGLAFKLYDPNHLLGDKTELGITCALIPANTPGVEIGRRHFPLCSHFPNGPTKGKNVFIRLSNVIGGRGGVGAGWRMLMECLAAGRSISLPSMVSGGAKRAVFTSGAYARIRRQFNTYIGAFGGIQEALVRIGGYTYLIESLRLFCVGNIDRGVKSSVASAIGKCHTTEYARHVLNDAMDIHGGKGICMGPNNYLAQAYIEGPISITVEGANILTRSMIIFGQGAIRCHPYVLLELQAAEKNELMAFDRILFKHLGMIISNKVRSFVLALTSGYAAEVPSGDLKRYMQHFSRFSASFSLLADVSMISLGAKLKRLERLSGRLGDMLSLLYMGSAVVKYYETEKNPEAKPYAEWACQHLLYRLQTVMDEFLQNFPIRWLARQLRVIVFPLGRRFKAPQDKLGDRVAELLLTPSLVRERLAVDSFQQQGQCNNPVTTLQLAFLKSLEVEPLFLKLHKARKSSLINGMDFSATLSQAIQKEVLTAAEAEQMQEAHKLRMAVINVDDFSAKEFLRTV